MDILINSEQGLFNPIMLSARILEDYFIKYTSIYTITTTNTVFFNKNFHDYSSARQINYFLFQFNFLSNSLVNFTYYSKNSSNDIWFNVENKSVINFENQNNSFLPYKMYSFKIIDEEIGLPRIDKFSYNNFIEPYFYLILQVIIAIINICVSIFLFLKKDVT